MAVYIELVTDPFDARFKDREQLATTIGAGLVNVRRPTRGLEVKDDTYAYIKLVRSDTVEIPIFDSSSPDGMSTAYSNFILQSVQEQRMEKHQIVETFGDTYLFLFGESPRFLNVQAVLINSHDFNWKAEFMANYETYLRGTKAVEMGARTYLFYDQNIVEGYILNCQVQETSDQPHLVLLSFQFFVTNAQNISLIGTGSQNFPIRSSALVPEGLDLREGMSGEGLELLTSAQTNNFESSFTQGNFDRKSPIRSLILDNRDEYTTAIQPTIMDLADDISARAAAEHRALEESVDRLESAIADLLQAYGVEDADDPFLMDSLGVGPTFLGTGVGIGAFAGSGVAGGATFGAVASAQAGAFAGGGIGIGARAGAGFSSSGSAFGGVSAGASTGFSTQAGFGLGVSAGASASARASVTARDGSIFSESGIRVGTSAFANASAANRSSTSYAYSSARAAARAGGYATAGSSLSFGGSATPSASSFAGARGSAGASVEVGGSSTAFSFIAAKGSLANATLPPVAALATLQRSHSWSKSVSWPSG
jgi:hypothetical protein